MVIVLAYFLPSYALIPLHAIIQVTSNLSRLSASYSEIPWRRLGSLGLGSLAGVVVCLSPGDVLSSGLLEALLPLILILFTWSKELQKVLSLTFPNPNSWGGDIFIGFLASCSSTLFGVSGPLLGACLIHSLTKDALVLSIAAINMSTHLLKVVGFLLLGFPFVDWIKTLLPLCGAAVIGSYVGTSLRHRLNQDKFQLSLKIVITLLCLGKMM